MTMTNNGRHWWAAGVLVVLTLLLGACGPRPPAPLSPESPSPAPPSPAVAPTVSTADTAFCEAIREEFALVPQLLEAQSERDSARQRSLLAEAKQANDKIVATAPQDQKRDVAIVIEAANAANLALAKSDTVPPAVMKKFSSPEYRAASTRVRAYVRDECQIDATVEPEPRAFTEPASSPSPRE